MENAQPPQISPELLEQHPLVGLALAAFLMLFALLVCAAIASWIFLTVRILQGKPVLTVASWSPRVWGLVDLLFAVVMIFFWQVQSSLVGSRLLGIERGQLKDENNMPLSFVTLLGVGNLFAISSIIVWVVVRHQATLAQLGFSLKNWFTNLRVGAIAAVAVLPVVYALMALVSIGMNTTYNHPLLDSMKRDGSLTAYLLAVISAALIAPVVEEFLFRVLLQGWLQSWQSSTLRAIILGASEDKRAVESLQTGTGVALSIPLADGATGAMDATEEIPSEAETSHPVNATDATPVRQNHPPLWPAIATGILFGLAHLGYGLSFIPLIILGIILGLLYRATNSIWPSLIVHCVLNSSSMIALGVGVLIESVQK
jgi:membrane protease YdiL (CAAX protease family)